MEFQVGDVVCSKAGRDEGTFLVVVGIDPLHLAGTSRHIDLQSMETNRALRRALRNLEEAGAVRVTKGG